MLLRKRWRDILTIMHNKLLVGVVSIFFAFVLFAPHKALVNAAPTPAPTVLSTPASMEDTTAMEGTDAEQKQEYMLPYPGMLPDSPLYGLKQVRDWILDKLIVDPLRRADFNVLQADKRLSMGVALMAKGNPVLAEAVVSKGEKYLNSAVYGLVARKTEGREVPAYMVERLTRSLAKHTEVLTTLASQSEGAVKEGFQGSLALVTKLSSELTKLQ